MKCSVCSDFSAEMNRKMIHPDTAKLLHELLEMLAEEGEEKTFSYIKHVLLKQKKY